jgi:membrane fusion protein (multidrug efflux system)
MFKPSAMLATLVAALCQLGGCGNSQTDAAQAGQMPPPQVGVLTVQLQSVPLITELPGRLEAFRVAQVRARVAGVVQARVFAEGSSVAAGQVLYRIDPATYRASLDAARAAQAKAEANLSQAAALLQRYQPLQAAKAISPQEFLNAQVAAKQAQADVAAAQAVVQSATIQLGYTTVTAPISGRVGRALVTEGALVGQGEATPLAVVQQIDPLYVNITQSASQALHLRRALAAGKVHHTQGAEVHLVLEDGSQYPMPGKLLFSDLTVDATSGQVSLRAQVPNPQFNLLPGLYVRVRLTQGQVPDGVLLPQQAVTRNSSGDTVMIVDAQGQVMPRPVKLGGVVGQQWVVLSGLKTGEQVMVDGFQKLRPKMPVKPVPWQPEQAASASVAAS